MASKQDTLQTTLASHDRVGESFGFTGNWGGGWWWRWSQIVKFPADTCSRLRDIRTFGLGHCSSASRLMTAAPLSRIWFRVDSGLTQGWRRVGLGG